jgi:glycosyltransferase involved in cell wall biosynthesis
MSGLFSIRVAVFCPYGSLFDGVDGGGASYEKAVASVLDGLRSEVSLELIYLLPKKPRSRKKLLGKIGGRSVAPYRTSFFERVFSASTNPLVKKWISRLGLLQTEKLLKTHGVDLVYFSSPSPIALRLETLPYIYTVWDLGHRDLPSFPEMGAYREWVFRERLYQVAVPRAFHVMVDSSTTGHKLESLYGLERKRWSAIGLLPIVPKDLPKNPLENHEYVIYPAARWSHKNHMTLLEAMVAVVKKFPKVKLVLTGKDEGYGTEISKQIMELGLEDSVIDRGFVSKEETLALISGAKVLTMPSLLGPTNLPPLEALILGVPAIVSDAHEYGTEVDDFLTKVPATDVEGWVNAICLALEENRTQILDISLENAVKAHATVLRNFARLHRH